MQYLPKYLGNDIREGNCYKVHQRRKSTEITSIIICAPTFRSNDPRYVALRNSQDKVYISSVFEQLHTCNEVEENDILLPIILR